MLSDNAPALLSLAGLPVAPIDPDELPEQARALLGEWAADFSERRKKAMDEGEFLRGFDLPDRLGQG